eukprot:1800105-Pleurochrysis_carterae.AAC.1
MFAQPSPAPSDAPAARKRPRPPAAPAPPSPRATPPLGPDGSPLRPIIRHRPLPLDAPRGGPVWGGRQTHGPHA